MKREGLAVLQLHLRLLGATALISGRHLRGGGINKMNSRINNINKLNSRIKKHQEIEFHNQQKQTCFFLCSEVGWGRPVKAGRLGPVRAG